MKPAVFYIGAATLIVIPSAHACGGYKVDRTSIRNCGESMMQFSEGFTSQLSEDCQVHTQGCITINEQINQSMVTYDILKDGMVPLKGSVDACKEMNSVDDKTFELVMTLAGLPRPECPVSAGKRCANGSTIDVSKFKSQIAAAAGSYKGRVTSHHGDGKSCCFEFEASILRRY